MNGIKYLPRKRDRHIQEDCPSLQPTEYVFRDVLQERTWTGLIGWLSFAALIVAAVLDVLH